MEPVQDQYCIELKEVSFEYNSNTILDRVSFQIGNGDYVGILGPNGSGKTTLLKVILGLLKPSFGSVHMFGEEIQYFKNADWIGYVPQRAAQSNWEFPATVKEIVETGRYAKVGLFRRLKLDDHTAVQEAMEQAEVIQFKDRLINHLSGGERQRVFIARALAGHPKVLILDEPTVGVDIVSQESFYSFIKELNEKQGMTIIFVSHDIDVITHEAKTILCLNKELVCHVASRDFISKGHFEKLYGEKGKYILHGH